MMAPLFSAGGLQAHVLAEADLPRLQAFFEQNPLYFETVNGLPPRPDEARQEFFDRPPTGLPYRDVFTLGMASTEVVPLQAMASVLADFLVPGVWHIGLFIVDTHAHGSGLARQVYQGLEDWIRGQGAEWLRLGAVLGNGRAEAFWQKMGYTEVRRRHEVPTGEKRNTIRVFVKPLAGGRFEDYLQQVPRDQPDSPLP